MTAPIRTGLHLLALGLAIGLGGAPDASGQGTPGSEPRCEWLTPGAAIVTGLTPAQARIRAQTTGSPTLVGEKAEGPTEFVVEGILRARRTSNVVLVEEIGPDGSAWRVTCPTVRYLYEIRRPDRERVVGTFLDLRARRDSAGAVVADLSHGGLVDEILDEIRRMGTIQIRLGVFDTVGGRVLSRAIGADQLGGVAGAEEGPVRADDRFEVDGALFCTWAEGCEETPGHQEGSGPVQITPSAYREYSDPRWSLSADTFRRGEERP